VSSFLMAHQHKIQYHATKTLWNINLYDSALLNTASDALGALNTAEKDASWLGDRSWQCWDLDRAV